MSESRFTVQVEDRFGTITDAYEFDAGEFIVGRSKQCDIILPADNVSRRHAKLFTKDGVLFIEDLGSANGTFVNGKRIKKATLLLHGNVVKIGDYHLHVFGGPTDLDADRVYLRLIGLNLSVKDEVFEIKDKTAVIGRGSESQVVVVDPSVSRIHARFVVMDQGSVLVKDLGSANGTFVNGKKVNTWELHSGDTFQIGDLKFKVELPLAQTTRTRGDWKVPTTYQYKNRVFWTLAGLLLIVIGVLIWWFWPSSNESTQGTAAVRSKKERPKIERKKKKEVLVDITPLLKEAKKLLLNGEVDQALAVVQQAEKMGGNGDKLKALKQRINKELINKTRNSKAVGLMKEHKWIEAARELLKIPKTSVFYNSAKTMMQLVLEELALVEKKTCRRGRRNPKCKEIKVVVGQAKSFIDQAVKRSVPSK